MKAHIVSLGCPKNLTDSEVLMGQLVSEGYSITNDPSEAEMIVVNTCAFLKSAREESLSVINEMAAWKNIGKCQKLYVAGCLPKYSNKPLKDVDEFIDSIDLYSCKIPRVKATRPWTAYVKIAEGCNNRCTYCLIPSIRGKLRTRKVSDILSEVKNLAKNGVKEVIYVAQDTTAHPKFVELLKKTAKIKGIRWIRIMYTHPKHISAKLIETIAKEKKIVKYIDMPIQHASDKILKAMGRKYPPTSSFGSLRSLRTSLGAGDRNTIEILLKCLRDKVSGIAIRTSLIVGFPGETEKDFNELVDLVKTAKFDRLGVFPYSREDKTPAGKMNGQVSEKVKKSRVDKLMKIQAGISLNKNRSFIGKKMEVIIEGKKGKYFVGRTYRDAPEIDGNALLRSDNKKTYGDVVNLYVTAANIYDLFCK